MGPHPNTDVRAELVHQFRDRIEQGGYAVDAREVAAAIVRKLAQLHGGIGTAAAPATDD